MAPTRVYSKKENKWELSHIITYELTKFEFELFAPSFGFAYITSYEDDSVKVKKLILPLIIWTRVYDKKIFYPE